jgi:5,6-dimethylbenzimidazole synthase
MHADRLPSADFRTDEREAVYRCIFSRRDVRSRFLPDPLPDHVLARILRAAHHAPSVGFMQRWDFIVVRDAAAKRKVREAFDVADREAAAMFEGEKRSAYRALKLQGIEDAPVGICITCDRARSGPVVLGRTHQREMDLYSAVCAAQNLWLAARAESVGVGWVSIMHYDHLRAALAIPASIQPIAYLCVGYVSAFAPEPDLQAKGCRSRMPLEEVVWFDRWQSRTGAETLLRHLEAPGVRDRLTAKEEQTA